MPLLKQTLTICLSEKHDTFSRPSENFKTRFETKNEIDTIAVAKRLIDFPDVTLYTIVTK